MSINFHHEGYKLVGCGLSVREPVSRKTTVNNYNDSPQTSKKQKLLNQSIMQIPLERTNRSKLISFGSAVKFPLKKKNTGTYDSARN
jgi:hypothetical protein